jgi:Flp pilus assembly protein CpaB
MRRGGRILIFLIIIIVLVGVAAFFFLSGGIPGVGGGGNTKATATPQWVSIVVVNQPVARGSEITADALGTMSFPPDKVTAAMVTKNEDVIGKFAKYPLSQGVPLTFDMIEDTAGLPQVGSDAAKVIPPGMTAITIPITRLTAAGFGIQDGDHVNIIATMLFLDVDPSYQTSLPNWTARVSSAGYLSEEAPLITADASTHQTYSSNQTSNVGESGQESQVTQQILGRTELDPVLNMAFYVVPNMSESQRPRLVSQMVIQNVQVLHVGDFELQKTDGVKEQVEAQAAADQGAVQATPQPGQEVPVAAAAVKKPDIITLIVTPQDAVMLTYLLNHRVNLTLTLRGPEDQSRVETEAATLQYLLSQYAIPVPAKLPYVITPPLNAITTMPVLPNDIPTPIPDSKNK